METIISMEQAAHAANHPLEYRLFWALDDDGDSQVNKSDLVLVLERNGLSRKDPRLGEFFTLLDELKSETLDFKAFLNIIKTASTLIEQVMQGDLALPDFAQFSETMTSQFAE